MNRDNFLRTDSHRYRQTYLLHYYCAKIIGDFVQYLCLTRSILTAHHIERFQRSLVTGFNGNRLLLDFTFALRLCRITGGRQNGSVQEYEPFPRPWPGKHRRECFRVNDGESNVLMASRRSLSPEAPKGWGRGLPSCLRRKEQTW